MVRNLLLNLEFTIYDIFDGENLASCRVGWNTPPTIAHGRDSNLRSPVQHDHE